MADSPLAVAREAWGGLPTFDLDNLTGLDLGEVEPEPNPYREQTRQHLDLLFGPGEEIGGYGYVGEYVKTGDGPHDGYMKHRPFTNKTEAIAEIRRLDEQGKDVYISMAVFKEARYWDPNKKCKDGTRGGWRFRTEENADGARNMWLDVDCGPEKGKPDPKTGRIPGYFTKKEAVRALHGFCMKHDLPIPHIAISGNGLHCYWQLDRYLPKAEWKDCGGRIAALAEADGFRVDPSRTDDIASVLRPWGSRNWKDKTDPKWVHLETKRGIVSVERFQALPKVERKKPESKELDGVIAAFNAKHDVREYLISKGYEDHGDKLLYPGSTTGNPGVWLDDDGKAISHHGDDPLHGNPRDAFDCYRILEHGGDWSKAIQAARAALGLDDEDISDNLVEVGLDDFDTATLPTPNFAIHPIVPLGHVTLFSANGEAGKTYIMLVWAVHLALGANWGGMLFQKSRVMFVSLEDDAMILRYRLRRIFEAYGFMDRADEIKKRICIIDASEAGALSVESSQQWGIRTLVTTSTYERTKTKADTFKPDVIFVDNMSDALDGDENARRIVRPFIKQMKTLGASTQAAVVLAAHVNKASAINSTGQDYSGSTAAHNSSRSRIVIIDGAIHHQKSNLGRKLDRPIPIMWADGVPKPDVGGAHAAAELAQQQAADDAAVLAAIWGEVAQGGLVPSAGSGASTAWHAINARPELPPDLRDKSGKQRVKEACNRLASAGRIRREDFKGSGGHTRQKWVPTVAPDSGAEQSEGGARECASSTRVRD